MADSTPLKRVLPARQRRESAAKRRAYSPAVASTPAKKQTPTPTPASSEPRVKRKYTKRSSLVAPPTPSNGSASPAPDELLPTKFTSSKSLPTSRHKQASQLSKKDYQSIADSAVLAASLHRSRIQWLQEGIFKKYWVKPVKRKGVIDVPPNNPDPKSMQKMGNGTITIEPHKFDVTFYVVRDAQTPLPYYRHPNQHTPKPAPYTPTPQPSLHPGTPTAASPATTPAQPPSTALKPENAPGSAPPRPVPSPAPAAAPVKPAPPKSSADPVIQMLAARAASDPHLKDLMKVVATSKASQEQLKEFQKHIDEFNEVVRLQEIEREQQQQANPQPAATTPKPAPPTNASPAASHPATYHPAPKASTPTTAMPPPAYSPYPSQPRPEALIKHIVVEFHGEGASPDRWLFPEYAVLDIRYGGLEMNVSYLVERTGAEIVKSLSGGSDEEKEGLQAKWKADTEYYQPITMHVRANQHKSIETIARGAKTLPAVQEYMKKVMAEKTKAAEEYLVHQLPREKALVEFVDSAVEMASDEEDDVLRDAYEM